VLRSARWIASAREAVPLHPPEDGVDSGACEPACPVDATYYEDDLPGDLQSDQADNEAFFTETLTGRDEPLRSPGGAAKLRLAC
jgi:hypothetical protein